MAYLSEAGHSVESYEHKLLQKFAAFVEQFEAKKDAPVEAPVAAPVVAAAETVVVSTASETVSAN